MIFIVNYIITGKIRTPLSAGSHIFPAKGQSINTIMIRRIIMKNENEEISEGLNQIFEIINAKGDVGELKEIVQSSKNQTNEHQNE